MCHASELQRGEQIVCWREGRILQYAWPHALRELRSGVREAESWTEAEFSPLGLDFISEGQSMAQMASGVALVKLKHLDRLPYLLARWGEGNVKDRALEQFASVSIDMHEPLTTEFLEEGTLLRSIMDSCSELQCLENPHFARALSELRNIP